MVAIAPFRALRYRDTALLPAVTSPPHDCITDRERDAFLEGDPRNVVRLVRGPDAPGDDDGRGPNRFTRAAEAFTRWLGDGTFARDAKPAFYHYAITHGPPGRRRTMHGLVARLRLDPTYTEVRGHEKTMLHARGDRLRLREATECDTEPIWLLYRDPRGWVDEIVASNSFDELLRFTDEEGHEHRLWRVDRPEAVAEVAAQFDDRTLVIADGHHRYQTALQHHAATGRPGHGSILVCLVRDNDPGLDLVATHRLVRNLPFGSIDEALRRATAWTAERLPIGNESDPAWAQALAAAAGTAGSTTPVVVGRTEAGSLQAYRLTPREPPAPGPRLSGLAVTLAHERLLRDGWGVDLDDPERFLRFTRSAPQAVEAVHDGRAQLAMLLPPEPVSAVLDVAREGHLMPQKATYFVPKLRSGVILSPLDEPVPQRWQDVAGDGGKAQWRMPSLG